MSGPPSMVAGYHVDLGGHDGHGNHEIFPPHGDNTHALNITSVKYQQHTIYEQ